MNSKPCVLIVSSSNTKPKSLIKLITKETPADSTDAIKTIHPWSLHTKYYKAEVDLIGITEDFERDDEFNERVEAVIVHMDSNKVSGLDDLKQWDVLESSCDPEIKLLLANYCNMDTKVSKSAAVEWCMKRGFEFIELYPTHVEEVEQDIIHEKFGVDRIVEALQAHIWPNLVMKGESKDDDDILQGGELSQMEDVLGDDGSDDFTELFNQLHMMKDSIQSLPFRERKQCAEQIVTTFWKAIGGDEEEIGDI